MGNSLFQSICRIGIFMICAQAVVHFRPKEAYEKYLKLLVSVMVLIQVFLPIGSFFLGDGSQDVADALERLGRELEQSMQEASEKTDAADRILEKMTLEEVLRRMEESGQGPESRETSEDGLRDAGGESEEEYVGKSEGSVSGIVEPVTIEPVVIEPVRAPRGDDEERKEH